MSDDLPNRMKLYELNEAGRRFIPLLPVIARLDGRSFHTFTKGMKRPFDEALSRLMINCTQYLVKETNANCGYTQSDEITLAWLVPDFGSQIFFDGRISKMISILAAMQSVYFNHKMRGGPFKTEHCQQMPLFDCRAWCVPNIDEGANAFLWREQDATKNSISMAARTYFSQSEVHGKSGKQMQEMLFQAHGINWNNYPSFFRRGTFIQRKKIQQPFSKADLEALPEKHHARQNPQLMVETVIYQELDMPPFSKVLNRPDVIFNGADPVVATI